MLNWNPPRGVVPRTGCRGPPPTGVAREPPSTLPPSVGGFVSALARHLTWSFIVCSMQRLTVSIPEQLAEAVNREARRKRIPVSEVVRQALAARFQTS